MPVKNDFNKENIIEYLNELAEEYKKLNKSVSPVKLILVGGASILLNYNFRATTGDIDVLTASFSKYGRSSFVRISSY